MSNLHIQEGKVMPHTPAADVAVNEVVALPDMIGVALGNIAADTEGQLAVEEVFVLAKETPLEIEQGDQLYWDATNNVVDKTDTNTPCGKAFAYAASAATTVQVKLNA